jgi:hypothetical protein
MLPGAETLKQPMATHERMTAPAAAGISKSEERRDWLRIDEYLLFDYRLAEEPLEVPTAGPTSVTKDMISVLVNKPTLDLLARTGESLEDSPLLPWFSKIDWLLETILTSLATIHPGSVLIPRLTHLNISAGGLSFVSDRPLQADAVLALRFIIPPFIPIQTQARVIRATPVNDDKLQYKVAVEFTTLTADDQEHVIKHIIRAQAEQLRARKQGHDLSG